MSAENIVTVSQLAERNPAFAETTIRWWIANAEKNGFGICLIRIGGRVFIDMEKFEKWLENHRVEKLSP